MKENKISRRNFMQTIGNAGLAIGLSGMAGRAMAAGVKPKQSKGEVPRDADGNIIPGFRESDKIVTSSNNIWKPYSDRKVRVGIAGFGLCQFGAQFSFQTHPNVEVVAVTDLDPGRCAGLAKACNCKKTYPSCEKMIMDKNIDAIFIATDAPSHARLAVMALNHGKHVASAVPAVFGFRAEKDAELLFKAVKKSGKKYMMFETTYFHEDCYAWRQEYKAGALGKLIYSEGEYYHYGDKPIGGYNPKTGNIDINGWRKGVPPMWYPTHSTGYYVGVSGKRLIRVSGLGMESIVKIYQLGNNDYNNPFGTEVALLKTSEGGMSRMTIGKDMPAASGEKGRVYGQKTGNKPLVNTKKPQLPPGVIPGGHGGSHGYLMDNYIRSIILDKKPEVDICDALNMTMAGFIANKSAHKDGEWMKIPQYKL